MQLLRLYKSLVCSVISQVNHTQELTHIPINFCRFRSRKSTSEMANILGITPHNLSPGTEAAATPGARPAEESEGDHGVAASMAGVQSEMKDGHGEDEAGKPHGPLAQLSRRARKRIIRNKEREAKKEGRVLESKRRKKDEDRVINFTDEMLQDAEYYIQNGLRKVYPYPFNYTTYAKGRWIGQNILEIFVSEFKAYPKSTYEKAINAGRMLVNGKKVTTDYVFKDNDYVENIVHRHELPVTAVPIRVLLETDDVVVIDKPSSIPIHPCGRFRHNSLTYIMAKELGFKNLRTIYRLDRLTSGVFILCKTDKQTQLMQGHIQNREVEKTYVARVAGEFPSELVECREPIDILSPKIGLFKVGPNGKEALTVFERLSYNGKTSIVLCKPHTGRTHQIRIHLQYLGFPIENDPLYNTHLWGPNHGKGGEFGKSDEQLVDEIVAYHTSTRFGSDKVKTTPADNPKVTTVSEHMSLELQSPNKVSPIPVTPSTDCDINEKSIKIDIHKDIQSCDKVTCDDKSNDVDRSPVVDPCGDPRPRFDAAKLTVDPLCEECQRLCNDPKPTELIMYLHALSYSGPGWKYETELPDWAHKDWVPIAATYAK